MILKDNKGAKTYLNPYGVELAKEALHALNANLDVFQLLNSRDLSTSEIVDSLGLSRDRVMVKLRALRLHELITTEKRRNYINTKRINQLVKAAEIINNVG